MIIPSTCDLCGSPTKEGDPGQSWWLCTKAECNKSNLDWMLIEAIKPYAKSIDNLNNEISNLIEFKIDGFKKGIIRLDETHWIGQGSGRIIFEESGIEIKFYFEDDQIIYLTNNIEILEVLRINSIDAKLKKLWSLKLERNSIMQLS